MGAYNNFQELVPKPVGYVNGYHMQTEGGLLSVI
jgi:hypothetical protein